MAFINIHSTYFANFASTVLSGYVQHANIKKTVFSHTGNAIKLNSFTNRHDSRRIEINTSVDIQQTVFEAVLSQELNTKGGALYTQHSSIALWSCFFSENRAESGAACAFQDSNVELMHTNFSRNYATISAGAIHHTGQQLSIYRCNIQKCESEKKVGALYTEAIHFIVKESIFYHNRAYEDAGCIRVCNSSISIFNFNFFVENQCLKQRTGAAIDLRSTNATFTKCFFTNNLVNGDHFPIFVDFKSNAIMNSTCLSFLNSSFNSNMSLTFGTKMIFFQNDECSVPNMEIPEIQEEFPIESEAQSTLGSWQFFLSLCFLIGVPIIVIFLLPDLNIFS